jgi:hypothetical protein
MQSVQEWRVLSRCNVRPGDGISISCTLYLGASHLANRLGQHLGERGDIPRRKESLPKERPLASVLRSTCSWDGEVTKWSAVKYNLSDGLQKTWFRNWVLA